MKLQHKFILMLLGAIVTALIGAQIFQQVLSQDALKSYARENLKLLEQRERLHAENIYQTIQPVVETTIALGEMSQLEALINSYRQIEGLLDYSLYNSEGMAAYSTSRELLQSKQLLPQDLKEQLLGNRVKISRSTDQAFEIYQPMVVTAKCLDCHDTFKEGAIGGFAALRLSKHALEQAQQQATSTLKRTQNTGITVAVLATLIVAATLIVLTCWAVKRLITVPLTKVIARLEEGAEQLNSSSAEIATGSQALAEGANKQAASLEETSASLQQMAAMTASNAESAQKVKELARQTRNAAEGGSADMKQMSAAMEAAKTSSSEIGEIIKAINEIAFQTNLLALNASVEAARAGEAGLGFAVVAKEVHRLAQRCAHAAKETANKIENARSKTAEGAQLSAKVAHHLQAIVAQIREVDQLATEVANASAEQNQGLSQVRLAVGQMNGVTQSNAAAAEESANASEELAAQAQAVQASVLELLELVAGHKTQPTQMSSRSASGSHQNASLLRSLAKAPVAPVNNHPPPAPPSPPELGRTEKASACVLGEARGR